MCIRDSVYSVDNFLRPGETKSADSRNTFLGGKGFNQSIALAKAGIAVYHAGNAGEMCIRDRTAAAAYD